MGGHPAWRRSSWVKSGCPGNSQGSSQVSDKLPGPVLRTVRPFWQPPPQGHWELGRGCPWNVGCRAGLAEAPACKESICFTKRGCSTSQSGHPQCHGITLHPSSSLWWFHRREKVAEDKSPHSAPETGQFLEWGRQCECQSGQGSQSPSSGPDLSSRKWPVSIAPSRGVRRRHSMRPWCSSFTSGITESQKAQCRTECADQAARAREEMPEETREAEAWRVKAEPRGKHRDEAASKGT